MHRGYFLAAGVGILAIVIMLLRLAFHSTTATASVSTTSASTVSASDGPPMLKWFAKRMNATLPKKVDDQTRLDRTDTGPGNTFNLHFVEVSRSSRSFNPLLSHSMFDHGWIDKSCHSDGVGKLIKMGVTVNYIFEGNDGGEITRYTVTPSDCGVTM